MRFLKLVTAVILGGLVGITSAADSQPTPEQLYAAATNKQDFAMLKIDGDWGEGGADFSGWTFEKKPESGYVRHVGSSLYSWPAKTTTLVRSMVNLFTDTSTAAAAYKTRLEADVEFLGPVVGGPAVGEESRYHRRAASADAGAMASVRFRHGRYLLKIESESWTKPLDESALKGLARRMLARLARLEASRLSAPPLPQLASHLPEGDGILNPVLGTATGPSDWLVWEVKNGKSQPSAKLRHLLREGVGSRQSVVREYGLANIPDHCAMVGITPFRDETAARKYFEASTKQAQRGERDVSIESPSAGGLPTSWVGTVLAGRHVAEVQCFADAYGSSVSQECEQVVRSLAARVKAGLEKSGKPLVLHTSTNPLKETEP